MKLDEYDRRILELLQRNARISNQDLAEQVGLSASPCSRRIKALTENGIIDRYVTLLNPKKLGYSLTALVMIGMDRHTPERFAHFEEAISQLPEVQECYLVTGQSADYVLKLVVRDMEHFERFLLGALTRIEGVSGVQSSFILRRPVNKTEFEIPPDP